MRSRRLTIASFVSLAIVAAATGCGAPREDTRAQPRTQPGAKPTRIVSLAVEDHLCALGIRPIAARPGWGSAFRRHVEPCLRGTTVLEWINEIRVEEQIAMLRPDLVLVRAGEDPDVVRRISAIAPTQMLFEEGEHPGAPELLRRTARLVGKEALAEELIVAHEAHVARTKACLAQHPHESAAIVWLAGRELRIFEDAFVHQTLQIPRASAFAGPLSHDARPSFERLAHLDATHVFVFHGFIVRGSDDGLRDLFATAAWQALPAVRAGNVHLVHDDYWTFPTSVISQGLVMDDLERAYGCVAGDR